ncbi:MAG: MCE family protein [Bacteroidaceae bacterium]|nr:MCE family protein [Bacteroidaceae bacterium]
MKFLTKEVKIALTAIVAVVLLFFTINFLKGVNVFKSSNTYYVQFTDIAGLAVSNAVYANGYPVGIVRDIEYDYTRTDKVVVAVELDKNMNIPRGTRAELETGLMGGVTMSLVLGQNPADVIARGDTILGGMHLGTMAKVEEMLPAVAGMLPKLDSILYNINTLTASPALAQTLGNAAEASANLNRLVVGLNETLSSSLPPFLASLQQTGQNVQTLSASLAGNVGSLDVTTTLDQLNGTLGDARTLIGGLETMTQNLQTASEGLNTTLQTLNASLQGTDNTLGLMLNDRQLYDNLNLTAANLSQTAASADSLLRDLKAHPKRYVHFSVFGKKDK